MPQYPPVEINPYQSPVFNSQEGIVPPRGTGVLAALADGLRHYVQNWPLIVAVTLIVHVPLTLWSSYSEYFVFGPDDIQQTLFLQQFQEVFLGVIAAAAIQHIVSQGTQQQRPTLWSAFRCALRLWPRMCMIAILTRVLFVIAFAVFFLPGIYFLVVVSLVDVVAVVENRSAIESLNRSRELARGHFWFLFAVSFLAYCANLVFAIIIISPIVILDEVHWLLNATLEAIASLALPYAQVCLFAAYRQLVKP